MNMEVTSEIVPARAPASPRPAAPDARSAADEVVAGRGGFAIESKRCPRCEEVKPLDAFYARSGKLAHLRRSRCKTCEIAENIAKYPGKVQERMVHHNRKVRLARYGLTPGDFQSMLAEQGGVCLICGRDEILKRALSVDHCHTCGAVRGLLCCRCNFALGAFGDSAQKMRAAAGYLRRAERQNSRQGIVTANQLEQSGWCAACGNAPSFGRLIPDVDPTNRRPRALVCRGCHGGLRLLDENPDFLEMAARYVERHSSPTPQLKDS